MPLSCMFDDDIDYYANPDDDFSQSPVRSFCQSCGKIILPEDCVLRLECYRYPDPESDDPVDIKAEEEGSEICLPDEYHCERCGEIYLTLSELGYIFSSSENMEGLLEEYQEMTGFDSAKYHSCAVNETVEEK